MAAKTAVSCGWKVAHPHKIDGSHVRIWDMAFIIKLINVIGVEEEWLGNNSFIERLRLFMT